MKLLLSLCIVFGCSLLSSLAQEKKSGAKQKIEISLVATEYVTVRLEGARRAKTIALKDLLEINKLVPSKNGLSATVVFTIGFKEDIREFRMLFELLKATLEKQNCKVYESYVATNGMAVIYVYGPNKAKYEARQKRLQEQHEARLHPQQKAQAEFSKDITFMKLMEAKCRENKWKNFDWKIDGERSISMLSASHEKPDIEPILIRVNGADEFIVNKTEILNLEQIKVRLNEYKQMAMSSGSKPIIAVHTGKLSAAVVHPVLVKLHQLGLTNIIFSKPKREATPVVKPPVNRRPASPHR